MNLKVNDEFRLICEQIWLRQMTDQEWSLIESDDLIQTASFEGGYDADESAFCFSYYDQENKEYWFQLTLQEIEQVANGMRQRIPITPVQLE